MPGCMGFTRFRRASQRLNGFLQQRSAVFPAVGGQFVQRCDQLLHVLWAGALALQETFNVAGNKLPLQCAAFFLREVFGCRDAVSSGLF